MADNISKYQRLTPREHILKRSGMYIGNKNNETCDMYTCNDDFSKITKKSIIFNAGFIKLYDEILTNASDHFVRTNGKVKNIKININTDDNSISIYNDGPGIPIKKKDNIWIPQMLFGELLTGENYDDSEERFVGGMNGIGSCAVNILSKKFIVDCHDGENKYIQVFENNLEKTNIPKITKNKDKSYTKITYYPDLNFFDKKNITDDDIAFMRKRAFDIAIYCKCNVYFNDVKIDVKTLIDYAKLHLPDNTDFFYEKLNDSYEIVLTQSENGNFNQCSIVNGISTYKGGTHVDYIMNNIVKRLSEDLTKGNKGLKIKSSDIKNSFHLFLVSRIANPIFDSQTKENLSIKITDKVDLSDKLYKQLLKSDIIKSILEWVQMKEQMELNKMNKKAAGKTVRVEKLVDAHKAGTSESLKCNLLLSEGDCLDENTNIKIFKNDDYIDIKLKDISIGDMVITHKGNIKQVYGISKKVKNGKKITYNNTEITCSNEHKLLVYNKLEQTFEFLQVKNIDKNKHQLIKSKLFNLDMLYEIKNISKNENNDKFQLRIELNNSYIDSSYEHKYTILNLEKMKFELIEAKLLKKGDLIVSISPS